jgi:hypothetical protein
MRKDDLKDLVADVRIVMKCILEKADVKRGLDSSVTWCPMADSCEHDNECWCSVKGVEF